MGSEDRSTRTPMQRLLHGILILVLDAGALLLLSEILPGFVLDGPAAAFAAAGAAGLANALLWPVLARFTLRLSVLTLGLSALVLNSALLAAVISLLPDAHFDGPFEALTVTFGLTILTALFSALFAIDEDDTWYRNVVGRQAKRKGQRIESEVPGVVFLEIDGLAHDVLRRALADGSAPTLARWIRGGDHHLRRWETDWSSQTGACQAGILHGDNDDMPAFRWWEKDRGKAIVTNHARDAEEIERRHSDGRGLLHADGASRANILSGDAPHSMLTMSTLLRRRGPIGRDYAAYFAKPYAVARTVVLAIAAAARERRAAGQQRRHDVQPRIKRTRTYAFAAAWATVVQLDLQIAAVVGDMLTGRPIIYTTFLAYDEIAHHSGVERPDALAALCRVDRQIARVAKAAADAPRPYRLIVLSDHGQSQGATFLDRYGESLEDVVKAASDADSVAAAGDSADDALAYMGAGLTEMARDDTVAGRTVRSMTRGQRANDAIVLDPDARREAEQAHGDEVPELSVMASGCLGLVTFPREPGRVTLEQLEQQHPRLVPALREHPGVGFVLARSERHGPVVLGGRGANYLAANRIEGDDPLAPFGPNARTHVLRTDGFAHCPDLVINSTYWDEMDEVAAFEELVGSHGGMGGMQSFPFVAHPADLDWPEEGVIGAEGVHLVFRHWLAELGHTAYAES